MPAGWTGFSVSLPTAVLPLSLSLSSPSSFSFFFFCFCVSYFPVSSALHLKPFLVLHTFSTLFFHCSPLDPNSICHHTQKQSGNFYRWCSIVPKWTRFVSSSPPGPTNTAVTSL
jgi:hypothetical protein